MPDPREREFVSTRGSAFVPAVGRCVALALGPASFHQFDQLGSFHSCHLPMPESVCLSELNSGLTDYFFIQSNSL